MTSDIYTPGFSRFDVGGLYFSMHLNVTSSLMFVQVSETDLLDTSILDKTNFVKGFVPWLAHNKNLR
jgi:hypothetical protein